MGAALCGFHSRSVRSCGAGPARAASGGERRAAAAGAGQEQGRAGQGRAGQGRAGQGRAGQGRAGQGRRGSRRARPAHLAAGEAVGALPVKAHRQHGALVALQLRQLHVRQALRGRRRRPLHHPGRWPAPAVSCRHRWRAVSASSGAGALHSCGGGLCRCRCSPGGAASGRGRCCGLGAERAPRCGLLAGFGAAAGRRGACCLDDI